MCFLWYFYASNGVSVFLRHRFIILSLLSMKYITSSINMYQSSSIYGNGQKKNGGKELRA